MKTGFSASKLTKLRNNLGMVVLGYVMQKKLLKILFKFTHKGNSVFTNGKNKFYAPIFFLLQQIPRKHHLKTGFSAYLKFFK